MQLRRRAAPSIIKAFRVQSFENGPWQTVLREFTLPPSSSNSTNLLYFGERLNVHKVELEMTGSQQFSNVGIMRVALVDSNLKAQVPRNPHDPHLMLPNTCDSVNFAGIILLFTI